MKSLMMAAGAVAFGLAAASAVAQPPPSMMQPMGPAQFVTAAGQSDQFEIREGQLALQRARDPAVRKAAQMMIHDHTESTRKMMAAAQRTGLPPMAPPPLDPQQQQMFAQLQSAPPAAFDRTYVDQQTMAHQKALDLMTAYINGGPDGPVKSTATQIRPVVKAHLTMWSQLQGTHA